MNWCGAEVGLSAARGIQVNLENGGMYALQEGGSRKADKVTASVVIRGV